MPYSTVSDVKVVRLRISATDTSEDSNINEFITHADALIDERLKKFGVSVPLADPSERIRKLSADIAALLYQKWLAPNITIHEQLRREIEAMLDGLEEEIGSGRTALSSIPESPTEHW